MQPAEAVRYANEAGAAGIKVIWNPWTSANTWRGDWVDVVKTHPATWGFYVGDEAQPGSQEANQVRSLSQLVRHQTDKPTLYISRPGRKALRPFLDVASHAGPDCYPIGKPASWSKPDPQRMGNEPGGAKKMAFVCQAFSWSVDYPDQPELPWPTPEQMSAMRRAVMRRGHPDMLLWFCFHCITDYNPPGGSWAYWDGFASVVG